MEKNTLELRAPKKPQITITQNTLELCMVYVHWNCTHKEINWNYAPEIVKKELRKNTLKLCTQNHIGNSHEKYTGNARAKPHGLLRNYHRNLCIRTLYMDAAFCVINQLEKPP